MSTAARPLSYEEWLLLPENDGREQCVNGVIEAMPPNKSNHVFIVENLADQLPDAVDRRQGLVLTANFGLIIRTSPLTQRTPDIAVFEKAAMVIRDGYFHSAPALAVDVLSPADTANRMGETLADYRALRVPEVWFVDPAKRSVAVHRHDAVTCRMQIPSVDCNAIWPD